MRETKFRGKKLGTGEWVYGDLQYVPKERTASKAAAVAYISNLNENNIIQTFVVDPKTVGQFTGLKDSTKWEQLKPEEQKAWLDSGKTKKQWNGKEKWEADLVKLDGKGPICEIQWQQKYARWICYWDDLENGPSYTFLLPDKDKVIGNVHDNPELIRNENTKP
ncbi:hypothetical protein ES708_15140 [subsurface metagenome]